MTTVAASIPVLHWAAQRAHLSDEDVSARFRKWPLWLTGEVKPTLKQLEGFARLTHTAIGYFFLPEPPELTLPVQDFRTLRDEVLRDPSSALLDTVYLCQQRQAWYRDYARWHDFDVLSFVGSAQLQESPEVVAQRIRTELKLFTEDRRQFPTWTEALSQLIAKAEDAGVMVMVNSVVGSNSHRKLNVDEFRGFALSDDLAPLVFLNGSDSKSAQMFTLAHELAHIWLGVSGVSDTEAGQVPEQLTERWCNQVAAELLMPLQEVYAAYQSDIPIPEAIQLLARDFKVSTLVALRRLFDAGFIDQTQLWQYYRGERERLLNFDRRSTGGGDFYRTMGTRAGKRFTRAIVTSTLGGQTLFQDAFRMLGIRKTTTLYEAARKLGVTA